MGKFSELDISIHDIKNFAIASCLLVILILIISLIYMEKLTFMLKQENDDLKARYETQKEMW